MAEHGGKREGSGRPKVSAPKRMYSVRLPEWLVEWLRDQDGSQAEIIEDALVHRHKLKAPDDGA